MRKVLSFFLISLLWFGILQTLELEKPGTYVPGEIIVQFNKNANSEMELETILSYFKNVNLKAKHQLSARLNIWLLSFNNSTVNKNIVNEYTVLKKLHTNPSIKYSQLNHYIKEREIPNDPMFDLQWGMHNTEQTGGLYDADIDAPEAWDINTGGVAANGDTVIIAIVDSGCELIHSDLNFWKNLSEIPGNGIDDDNNGYIDDYDGWDAVSQSGNIPSSSHGTHVAGISAAIGNNSLGVAGVNWNAKIMPIRGSTSLESVAVEAYSYIYEMRALWNETNGAEGAFVVASNSSFGVNYGDPANYPIWASMYDVMGEAGIISATATMNINADVDQVGDMPTACDSEYMISVTNTTGNDLRNTGSAFGLTTIDLGAPGTSIRSTDQGNSYSNKTGTSMSSPHVAGAIAFLISAAPLSFLNNYIANPAEGALLIKQYLLDGTDPLSSLAGITVTGGRLNINNSLQFFDFNGSVSGIISEDTTWSSDIIQVTGDVIIADGVTVTINPGVIIRFDDNYKIDVEGQIISNGTEENWIEFVPADTLLGWGGLRYLNTTTENDSSLFNYTLFIKANSSNQSGGALSACNFSKISIDHCIFEENKTTAGGGAVHLDNSSIRIKNSSFIMNLAYGSESSNGGAISINNSNPYLSHNTFISNLTQQQGGAVWVENSGGIQISNSSFQNNFAESKGGAIAAEGSDLIIILSYLQGNMTPQYSNLNQGGAACFSSCNIQLINNLFTNNSSVEAGAVTLYDCEFKIINNTFSLNNCSEDDSRSNVALISNSLISNIQMIFANNILWGNGIDTSKQIALIGNFADPDFVYNNIQNGFDAIWVEEEFTFDGLYENNQNSDPVFSLEEPHLFALASDSPSINEGDPDISDYNLPLLDLAGNDRIFIGEVSLIDQGCYEYQGDIVEQEICLIPQTNGILNIYPNPFNPKTSIKFNLNNNEFVKIEIYNTRGQKIRTLINKQLPPGIHTIIWDGKNEENKTVASGIYFSRMETSNIIDVKKVMLLK